MYLMCNFRILPKRICSQLIYLINNHDFSLFIPIQCSLLSLISVFNSRSDHVLFFSLQKIRIGKKKFKWKKINILAKKRENIVGFVGIGKVHVVPQPRQPSLRRPGSNGPLSPQFSRFLAKIFIFLAKTKAQKRYPAKNRARNIF